MKPNGNGNGNGNGMNERTKGPRCGEASCIYATKQLSEQKAAGGGGKRRRKKRGV